MQKTRNHVDMCENTHNSIKTLTAVNRVIWSLSILGHQKTVEQQILFPCTKKLGSNIPIFFRETKKTHPTSVENRGYEDCMSERMETKAVAAFMQKENLRRRPGGKKKHQALRDAHETKRNPGILER